MILSISNFHDTVASCKILKTYTSVSHENWKTSFWAIFEAIFPYKPQNNNIVKIISPSFHFLLFYLLFGCPTASCGPLSRGLTNLTLIHCCLFKRVTGNLGSLSPAKQLVGFKSGTFPFVQNTLTN